MTKFYLTRLFVGLFILSLSIPTAQSQIVVDFEDATLSDTSFMAGGVEWKMTEDFVISEFDDFHCGAGTGINRYMDTGYSIGLDGSEGVLGSIAPIDSEVTFEMSTDHCAWPANTDGEFTGDGTFRFMGFLPDGTTIQQDIELMSSNFDEMVPFTFSADIWGGVELSSIQVEIIGTGTQGAPTDYLALDNLSFAAINVPTNVDDLIDQSIKVFPNPTSGMVQIEAPEHALISVYNNLGQLVEKDVTVANQSLDLTKLPRGMYSVSLLIDDAVYTRKIVLQ